MRAEKESLRMKKIIGTLASAVSLAYRQGQEDETLEPHVLRDSRDIPIGRFRSGDAVIFYNIRGEREIELSRSLTEKHFRHFPVATGLNLRFATLVEYTADLNVPVAFPPPGMLSDTLGETLSRLGIRQAKITEAEKAFHVSFFLNGKREDPLPFEERIVVPTRKDVRLFDEAPEMSVAEVADAVVEKIRDEDVRFIFANFANVDVVGHIENESAVLRAVEAVDAALGRTVDAARRAGITVLITADHGTVENWLYEDGTVDTGHTASPVPFVLVDAAKGFSLRGRGELADVAPTVLQLLGIAQPAAMTGRSLIDALPADFRPRRRLLLILMDGWGYREETRGNMIAKAGTPAMDSLMGACPRAVLAAAGEAVGLPPGTVGNSEAGHLHIGAGRRVPSDRVRIEQAIADGSFFGNPVLLGVMREAAAAEKAVHLMGIVSFFSSHGSVEHLFALMEMARREGIRDLFIHAMLGRRGELPESGARYLSQVEEHCRMLGIGRTVSVIGRYWSMDREENWDRIEKTYRMLVHGEGIPVADERR
jgi:2,3-bisphosphoglycerate-independent phosphoglycerate mutase